MSLHLDNPFADYGGIVSDERFIGRRESLKVLEQRIIHPREPANEAVISAPRLGKSSLVYNFISNHKYELHTKRIVPIWINLATYQKTEDFFCSLVKNFYDELERLGWLSDDLECAAYPFLQRKLSGIEGYIRTQKFLEKSRLAGIRALFVLDEFDYARVLFDNNMAAFQMLRELSYRPEWRVSYIVIARVPIHEIEVQTRSISTLAGIFHNHYLPMFDDEEMEEYFFRLSSVGVAVNKGLRDQLVHHCGGHPYLIEMLGYELVEILQEYQRTDIALAFERIEDSVFNEYQHLVTWLHEIGKIKTIRQILSDKTANIRQAKISELIRYGLIKIEGSGLSVFSEHFHEYLKSERQANDNALFESNISSVPQKRRIKILFLAADPKDTPQLRLGEEVRAIDQVIRQSKFRNRFIINKFWATRVSELQEYLLRFEPDIVHFSGHGSRLNEIVLEDDQGNSHSVSVQALSRVFSIIPVKCVILNACYSEIQAQAIAEHVDYVIGMSRGIRDSASISFARAFYQAIGYGKDINTAFNLGCVQLDLENFDEQDTPKLLAF